MLQSYDVTERSPGLGGGGKETACDWCGFYWHREFSSERNPQLKGMKFCRQFVYHWWEGVMWKHFRFSFLRVTGVPNKRKRYKEWTNWSWHPRYCPVECHRTLVFRGGTKPLFLVSRLRTLFSMSGEPRRLISEFYIELHMYSHFTACRYKHNFVQKLYRLFLFTTFFLQAVVSKVEINLLFCNPHRRLCKWSYTEWRKKNACFDIYMS
jgi:hypothetical protein